MIPFKVLVGGLSPTDNKVRKAELSELLAWWELTSLVGKLSMSSNHTEYGAPLWAWLVICRLFFLILVYSRLPD